MTLADTRFECAWLLTLLSIHVNQGLKDISAWIIWVFDIFPWSLDFFLYICNVSIKLCLTKMLVLFIVSKIPISWGIDIIRWWRSVITTKFGQKWNSWLKAADELFWLRYASKTKGMFWVTPSHKIKWQERKPFSRLKCLKQNKTKTKGMLWVTHYHKIKWQERRPSSHLKCL